MSIFNAHLKPFQNLNSLSMPRHPVYLLIVGILFVISSCATPTPPTGGPADKKGPEVEYTAPETGTTNFKGKSFEFYFSEFINRNSVNRAITVEPDLGIDYEVSWKKMRMTITFQEKFPDSTTVIIKLGTDISDTRNNKMGRTVTLAISTGDIIDSGRINGRVLNANTGRAAEEFTVLLYRQPWNLQKRANYSVRTDTGGYFNFNYLAEGNYKAFVVDDRNRNKTWEPSNEIAFPFYREQIALKRADRDTLDVIYVARKDTVAPNLQGVGLFSTQRLRLRFSENMEVRESAEIQIFDSLKTPYTTAYPLYISQNEKFVVFAQSSEPLLQDEEYNLRVEGFTDGTGNPVDSSLFAFTGSSQEDTTKQRIIFANDKSGLAHNQPFVVTYAASISEPEITDSLVVIEGNVDFENWPEIETDRNKLIIHPQKSWIDGIDYQFLVWNPVTQRRTMFEPVIWDSTEYGEMELVVNNPDSNAIYHAEILNKSGKVVRSEEFSDSTMISDLPPESYTLKIFEDKNHNGSWDQGKIVPYVRPERYHIQRGIRIQQGFTSEVIVRF